MSRENWDVRADNAFLKKTVNSSELTFVFCCKTHGPVLNRAKKSISLTRVKLI